MPLAETVDLDHLAADARVYAADLEALCREAAMTCLRRHLPAIDLDAGSVPIELLQKLEVTMEDFPIACAAWNRRPCARCSWNGRTRWEDVGGLDEVKAAV